MLIPIKLLKVIMHDSACVQMKAHRSACKHMHGWKKSKGKHICL